MSWDYEIVKAASFLHVVYGYSIGRNTVADSPYAKKEFRKRLNGPAGTWKEVHARCKKLFYGVLCKLRNFSFAIKQCAVKVCKDCPIFIFQIQFSLWEKIKVSCSRLLLPLYGPRQNRTGLPC